MRKTSPRALFPFRAAVLGLSLIVPRFCGLSQIVPLCSAETPSASPGAGRSLGEKPTLTRGAKQVPPPNVLLIGIDTLRADHIGCLGYMKDTTPTLDRLAREGVLCTRTMSTSGWTVPSVMSTMTALYPSVHHTCTHEDKLPAGITTLAAVLKAHGYTTAGFVGNPVIRGAQGFSEGFDLYDDFTVSLDVDMDILEQHDKTIGEPTQVCTNELTTRTALQWLRRGVQEPFLMFVFYLDPHYDYIPPAPFDTLFDPDYRGDINGRGIAKEPRHSQRPSDRDLQHLRALYDGEIRYTDACVAELLRALVQSGRLPNTLVVVFGDHGDEFYEHGKTAHDRTLYNEIIHVPLILWWPDQLPQGKRVDALLSLVDIMPTLLDYLDLSHEGPRQGTSLRPLIEGRSDQVHDTVWAELKTWTHVQAVIGNHDKLIRNVGNHTWELYHLPHDPRETTNLYDQSVAADNRRIMHAKWEQWTNDNAALSNKLTLGTKTQQVPVNEQQLQQLKSLGYVQ